MSYTNQTHESDEQTGVRQTFIMRNLAAKQIGVLVSADLLRVGRAL